MMVGDYDIHAQRLYVSGLLNRAYAVVDGDYQFGSALFERIDSLFVEPVALVDSRRNVVIDVRAHEL